MSRAGHRDDFRGRPYRSFRSGAIGHIVVLALENYDRTSERAANCSLERKLRLNTAKGSRTVRYARCRSHARKNRASGRITEFKTNPAVGPISLPPSQGSPHSSRRNRPSLR